MTIYPQTRKSYQRFSTHINTFFSQAESNRMVLANLGKETTHFHFPFSLTLERGTKINEFSPGNSKQLSELSAGKERE